MGMYVIQQPIRELKRIQVLKSKSATLQTRIPVKRIGGTNLMHYVPPIKSFITGRQKALMTLVIAFAITGSIEEDWFS